MARTSVCGPRRQGPQEVAQPADALGDPGRWRAHQARGPWVVISVPARPRRWRIPGEKPARSTVRRLGPARPGSASSTRGAGQSGESARARRWLRRGAPGCWRSRLEVCPAGLAGSGELGVRRGRWRHAWPALGGARPSTWQRGGLARPVGTEEAGDAPERPRRQMVHGPDVAVRAWSARWPRWPARPSGPSRLQPNAQPPDRERRCPAVAPRVALLVTDRRRRAARARRRGGRHLDRASGGGDARPCLGGRRGAQRARSHDRHLLARLATPDRDQSAAGVVPRASPGRPSPSTPTSAPVPRGAARVVFARCQRRPTAGSRARRPPGGARRRSPARRPPTAGRAPPTTVWGNRIAFAHHYATGSEPASTSVPSTRAGGCGSSGCPACRPANATRSPTVARSTTAPCASSSCAARRWPRTCISA